LAVTIADELESRARSAWMCRAARLEISALRSWLGQALAHFRDRHAGSARNAIVDQTLPGHRFVRARAKRDRTGEQPTAELDPAAHVPLHEIQAPFDLLT
jgi:hypothetical protein